MKKVLLLATAAMLVTGLSFANNGKPKKKKCAKGQTCCSKDKAKTADAKSCCAKDKKTAKI